MSASELPRPDLRSKEKRKRAKRSLPISEAEWDQAREEVYHKYIVEDCTQAELRKWLGQKHGLFARSRGLAFELKSD